MSEPAQIDVNFEKTLIAVTSDYTPGDGSTVDIRNLLVDPTTSRLLVNTTVTGTVTSSTPSAVLAGEKTVADTGTPEALASSTDCEYALVQAKTDNTSNCFVGNQTDGQYVELEPGQAWAFAIDNLNKIYIQVGTNGDGVNFTGG